MTARRRSTSRRPSSPSSPSSLPSPSVRSRSRGRPSKPRRPVDPATMNTTTTTTTTTVVTSVTSTLPVPFSSLAAFSPDNFFRRHAEFIEKPRQLAFLLMMIVCLAYWALLRHPDEASDHIASNIVAGGGAVALVFLTYCALQLRDGLMVRPHPMFWRITHGIGILYILVLAAFLVQSVKDSRAFLRLMFSDIAHTHDEQWNMQKDCAITAVTVYRQVSSVWMLSHVLGWYGKFLIFRDWQMCWIQSILFELLEISLQWLIPDFRECWWDSIFIDALGANVIGMTLGYYSLAWMNSKAYSWAGRRHALSRVFLQFTPLSWQRHHWEAFASLPRFLHNLGVIVVTLVLEITCFFMMHTLWIPPSNPLPKVRLIILGLLSVPGAAEYHEYMVGRTGRIGPNAWLLFLMAFLEVLICIKFSSGMFPNAFPPAAIVVPWAAFLCLFTLWAILFFRGKAASGGQREDSGKKKTGHDDDAAPAIGHQGDAHHSSSSSLSLACCGAAGPSRHGQALDYLFYFSFVPLLFLMRLWAFGGNNSTASGGK